MKKKEDTIKTKKSVTKKASIKKTAPKKVEKKEPKVTKSETKVVKKTSKKVSLNTTKMSLKKEAKVTKVISSTRRNKKSNAESVGHVNFDLSLLTLPDLINVYNDINDFIQALNESKIEVEEKGKNKDE